MPTEELIKEGSFHTLKINRLMVDGVIETPNGAHFTTCTPDYERDEKFQKAYADGGRGSRGVGGVPGQRFLAGDEAAYQAAVRAVQRGGQAE